MEKYIAQKRGFTLIELIIVIAIIAIIVAAVFVAMDPVKRLNTSRNSTRRTDALSIAQALNLYVTDTLAAGDPLNSVVDGLTVGYQMIGTGDGTTCPIITVGDATCGSDAGTVGYVAVAANCADLGGALVSNYLRGLPIDQGTDPVAAGPYTALKTGYAVKFEFGAYSVVACNPESENAGGAVLGEPDIIISR